MMLSSEAEARCGGKELWFPALREPHTEAENEFMARQATAETLPEGKKEGAEKAEGLGRDAAQDPGKAWCASDLQQHWS